MLIKFSVENFRSMKNKCEINFIATKDKEHSESLISNDTDTDLLPSLVLYGANGAGKSNVIMAFNTALYIIKASLQFQEGDKIPFNPFKLDNDNLSKPTKFEFLFFYQNRKYYYGFSFNDSEILEEYLYSYPEGRQTVLFERDMQNFTFKSDKTELKTLSKRTLKNRLFISSASEWNYEKIKIPFKYLKENIIVNTNYEKNMDWLDYTISEISKNENFKKIIIDVLKDLETGIVDLKAKIEIKKGLEKDLPQDLPQEFKNLLANKPIKVSEFKTIRNGVNAEGKTIQVLFDISEESKGTQKLLELLGPWLDMLSNGRMIIVDELDTSLHPILTRYLVNIFNNKKINTKGAQLFFSTHDTNLLDLDLLRRDQIFFTEKDKLGSTEIYSLSDLKSIRKDENIKRGYIRGKYGAIPYLTNEAPRSYNV